MDFSIGKILAATDLSKSSMEAVRHAIGLAAKFNSSLSVLHVIPHVAQEIADCAGLECEEFLGAKQWPALAAEGLEQTSKAIEDRVRQMVEDVIREMPGCPVRILSYLIEMGNPVEKITAAARKGKYDLVVMGTRGRTEDDTVNLGSVAAGVVRRCPKSVLVVRIPR
ncbi:MAG: universal stress protein [Thermodesulfobacteriota bacterium]